MIATGSSRRVVAVARFYLRPLRRCVSRAVDGSARHTWGVTLGPRDVNGHQLVLRSPRVGDAAGWQEARMRERERIEPWWASSPYTWEERHTEDRWITYVLQARQEARAGRSLPLVVEVDGNVAGQCNLEWISSHTGVAEMGIWMDSRYARKGLSTVTAGMMIDHAMQVIGVHRVVAPISEGNVAAAWGARKLGMLREGVMAGFLDVGGERRDHQLWAITADRMPEGGLGAAMQRVADKPRSRRLAEAPPA